MRRQASGLSCLLAINKPVGLSSHDVVNRVRRALGERRVGHAGTLDPAASGVMIVGVGPATRLLGMLTLDDKRYLAQVCFGTETSTDDAEGEVVREAAVPARLADAAEAQRELQALVGPCKQVPPAYSAISVGGQRAYARARAGQEVELPARDVTIYAADLIALDAGDPLVWTCSFHVSKGTYVRSIARDLGRACGTAAHLSGLHRTASGAIGISSCLTLEQLTEAGASRVAEYALDPVAALGLPTYHLNAEELADARLGRRLPCPQVADATGALRTLAEGERVALVGNQTLVGVWERRRGSLASVANFPEGVMGVTVS